MWCGMTAAQTATDRTIHLPRLHKGQAQVRRERKRHSVICCGRRWGKDIFLQFLATETVLNKQPVGWSAPVYRQLLDDFRALDNILSPIITRRSISEMRIEVEGGGVIDFHSLEKPDNIRGKKYARFIVNEAGFVPDLLRIRNFVIMPTLIDYQGDDYYSGTPKGQNGFWSLYNTTGADWMRWQMSSYANPFVPKSELDELKRLMPERAYQQEIMAQFLEDGGGVFRRVREAATLTPSEPVKDRQYVIGVDWGRSNDATVFCVMDAATKCQVYLDRMLDTDYASQRLRLKALADKYNRAYIIAEANSMGQPNIEALQSMGCNVNAFTTTNASKAGIIQSIELAFERGDIQIIADELQLTELISFQSEKLPSGLLRYAAPEGSHDDCVMSLALAWFGIARPSASDLVDFA
jgi:hypothetical protein